MPEICVLSAFYVSTKEFELCIVDLSEMIRTLSERENPMAKAAAKKKVAAKKVVKKAPAKKAASKRR